MRDKLTKTWSLKVHKGERFYYIRRFFWKLRFRLFPSVRKKVEKEQEIAVLIFRQTNCQRKRKRSMRKAEGK